ELQPERDLSRQALVQVMFTLNNMPLPSSELPGLIVKRAPSVATTSKVDLRIELFEFDSRLEGSVEYATDLFDRATIERFAGNFKTLLEAVMVEADRPITELPLLSPLEQKQLLVEWNRTEADYPSRRCVHELFAEQAGRTPEAIALIHEDLRISYGELEARSNQLAHHLRGLGVGPEMVVGLCVERSVEMVVGVLGILKAGGAYLPLDAGYPAERLAYMLDDAQVATLILQDTLSGLLPGYAGKLVRQKADYEKIAEQSELAPESGTGAENLAYVMYTSGSTGRPKGVGVAHRNIARLVRGTNYVTLGAGDRVAQLSNNSFDAATFEIWGALLNGGK